MLINYSSGSSLPFRLVYGARHSLSTQEAVGGADWKAREDVADVISILALLTNRILLF